MTYEGATVERRRVVGGEKADSEVTRVPIATAAVLTERVHWLYRNMPAAVSGYLIGALVTTGVLWRVIPRLTLLSWFVVCVCTTIPGLDAYRHYRRASASLKEPSPWARTYVLTSCVGGISWGAAGFVLFPPGSLGHQALLSLLLLGAAVGAVATDAVYFLAVAAFVIPCLTPLAIRLALEAKDLYLWWSAGAVFMMLLLLATARSLEKLFVGALVAKQAAEAAHNLAERVNQEKTRFLAAASHDLRQPLTSLAINTRLLSSHVLDAAGSTLHENVTAAVEDLKRVLNALLDISKLDAGAVEPEVQPVAVSALFEGVRRGFEGEARAKGLRLRVRSSKLVVRSDSVLLSRVISNLVSNAVRHTLQGGVLIGCRKRGDKASIEIWDTGVGIARDKWDEIFQEFRQLGNPEKDRRQGLGLGLAIARRISVLLSHSLEVNSVVGKGSRFAVLAPLTTASQAAARATLPPDWEFDPLLGASIGVIEDEASVRRDLEALLRQWGCLAVGAESTIQLGEVLSESDVRLEAVISDFQLRLDNGLDAIEGLRAQFGDLPAVLITGDTGLHTMRKAMERGIPVLQKPFEIDALRETLRALLIAARSGEPREP
jgi:two-component system, sensor histidine kinase